MKDLKIYMIACIQLPNRGIGKGGKLLYAFKKDMAHFKDLTMRHTVVMGNATRKSIGPKHFPLKERLNIVLTTSTEDMPQGVLKAKSIEEAFELAKKHGPSDTVWIMGGQRPYAEGMKYAQKLYLTEVQGEKEADVFFPEISEFEWNKRVIKNDYHQDDEDPEKIFYSVTEYVRTSFRDIMDNL